MEWAIPPNLQYTQGVFQIPTKRKQLTTAGPWDLPRPQSNFIRNPMRGSYSEGFQSSDDTEINKNLRYFTDTYAKAQGVLSDMPKEASNLLNYYNQYIENGNLKNTTSMVKDSPWDTEYKYYRFIFSDPKKCTTGTQTKIPDFAFEFHSMGRSVIATNSTSPTDKAIDSIDSDSQIYSNGVLLVRLKTKQSFSGIKWGAGNTYNKTPPIMTNWLLQASNNDSVWQDLNIADVFNELIQKDTTRFAELDDSTTNGYPSTTQISIYSKAALNRQIDQALRAILGAAIERFRTTYIELPPTIQSNLSFIFAQNDRDRSEAFNRETSKARLHQLVNFYLNVPIPLESIPITGPSSTSTYQDQMIKEIRQNLLNTIEKTQALAKKCGGPSGAPSTVSDAEVLDDLANIRSPTAAPLNTLIAKYTRYTNMAKQLTNTVDSQSRIEQLNPVNQDLKVIFKVPDGISTTSFADQTFNKYRIFLNKKLEDFYKKFMYTTVSIKDTSIVGAPSSAEQLIQVPVPYREFYDASIVDLYTTDRASGVSKGKQDYDSIWTPLTAGETPADRIKKLRELEALYDSYADTLVRSQAFAKQRFQTINMIEYFEECYRKVIATIAAVRSDMQASIDLSRLLEDKAAASKMEDKDQLAELFKKYNGLLYFHNNISVNTTERDDLLYCISKQLKIEYAKFWTNYSQRISYTDPISGTNYTKYCREFKRYVRNQDNTKYELATKPLFEELEDAWSADIKNENYKPTAVADSIGGPLSSAPTGAPTGSPSAAPDYSSLFGTRNAPDNSTSWDQMALQAIEHLRSQKTTGIRIIKSSVFATKTEEETYNTAGEKFNTVLKLYENLYNANELLDPADANKKGYGFIQRVRDCAELDSRRPKVVALIENYGAVYSSIINAYDPILTNQFINKVNGYDISGYVVNEINVMRTLPGILDQYDLSGVGQITTNEIPTTMFDPASKPGFSLHNLRITGAAMNGDAVGPDVINIGNVGTRITRYDISGAEAKFILSSDFNDNFFKMVMITMAYTDGKLTVKAEAARYVNVETDMAVQKDLKQLWDTASTSVVANAANATGYGITNLKIGYRNFYTKHVDDLNLLKSYNILSRTSVFGNTGAPSSASSSASSGIIAQLTNIQSDYYTESGSTGSGYFANLLTYISGISRDYIGKLQIIHRDFDGLFTDLFTTNWSKISLTDQTKFDSIRSLEGTQTFTNFRSSLLGLNNNYSTSELDTGINASLNTQRINNFAKTLENTETNDRYGYIHDTMIKTMFNHYISNTDSRYKKALLAITTYNFLKPYVHTLIRSAKTAYDTQYTRTSPTVGYYDAAFTNVNDSLNTYRSTTADTIINGIDPVLNGLRSTASNLWTLYNAKLTADTNKATLIREWNEWNRKKTDAETAKGAYNSTYETITDKSILPQYLIGWYNNKSTTFSYTNNLYTTPETNKSTSDTYKSSLDSIKDFIANYQPLPQRFQDAYNALYDRVAVDMNRYYLVIANNNSVNFITLTDALNKVRSKYPIAEIMTKQDLQKLRYIGKSICWCGVFYDGTTETRGYASISAWSGCGNCGSNSDGNTATKDGIIYCTNPTYGGIFIKLTTSETDRNTIARNIQNAINVDGTNIYFATSDNSSSGCWNTNVAAGQYVEPSAQLIKDLTQEYKEFRTKTYTYDFKTDVDTNDKLTNKLTDLKTNVSTYITECVGKINGLYSTTISKHSEFSSSLMLYLRMRTEKWFVLSDNNGITNSDGSTTMPTTLINHYSNIKIWITNFSLPTQNIRLIKINEIIYRGDINSTFSYSTTGSTSNVGFDKVGEVCYLFDESLLNFYNWYSMLYDFEFALQNDYFKKRRISLKSDAALNDANIVSKKTGMSVDLHTTLTNYYTTLDYLLVGGGGGGGGWYSGGQGQKAGGGGGGSGHFKLSDDPQKFLGKEINDFYIKDFFFLRGLDNPATDQTYINYDSSIAAPKLPNGDWNKYNTYNNSEKYKKPNSIPITSSMRIKLEIGTGGIGCGNVATHPDWKCSGEEGKGGDTRLLINDEFSAGALGGTRGGVTDPGLGANNGGKGSWKMDGVGGWNTATTGASGFGGGGGGAYGSSSGGHYGSGGGGGGGIGDGAGGHGAGWIASTSIQGANFTGAGGGGGASTNQTVNGASGGHGYAILYLTRTSDYQVPILRDYGDMKVSTTSGFQNQTPYNKPQVERKLLVNSLNTLDFTGSPVIPYTFGGFLQSLTSWFDT